MGMSSSRAHSVFTIHNEQKQVCDGTETILKSEMKFVELAGSERQNIHTTTSGTVLIESKNINKSFASLGMFNISYLSPIVNSFQLCSDSHQQTIRKDNK